MISLMLCTMFQAASMSSVMVLARHSQDSASGYRCVMARMTSFCTSTVTSPSIICRLAITLGMVSGSCLHASRMKPTTNLRTSLERSFWKPMTSSRKLSSRAGSLRTRISCTILRLSSFSCTETETAALLSLSTTRSLLSTMPPSTPSDEDAILKGKGGCATREQE